MTAFSSALYYPCTDPPKSSWLKSAILYWDEIHTIVPIATSQPYEERTALVLNDHGILQPLFVNSDMPEIVALSDDVLTYLDTPEGLDLLKPRKNRPSRRLAASKFPVSRLRINKDNLPEKIKRLTRKPPSDLEEWLNVDERFANYYMTLLATRLSDHKGLGLLTDVAPVDRFALTAKLDFRGPKRIEQNKAPRGLAQGMLADLILTRIEVDPDTPIETLLEFREQYSDELGFFRTKIAELTSTIETDLPMTKLKQRINDIYKNEYIPGFSMFKEALRGRKIKFVADTIFKVTFISVSATSLPIVLGASLVPALLAGASVSLTACAAAYNSERSDQISQSPYLYLIKAQKKLR